MGFLSLTSLEAWRAITAITDFYRNKRSMLKKYQILLIILAMFMKSRHICKYQS